MIPNFALILVSGGLDSVTMLHLLHNEGVKVHGLTFEYGQQHIQETTFAKLHYRKLGVLFTTLVIPRLGGLTDKDWKVPNRNAIFIEHAVADAVKIGADAIYMGCNKDDEAYFPDCRRAFFEARNAAIKAAGYDVRVIVPFLDKPKSFIAGLAREMHISSDSIWTCYRGGAKPCGDCPACLKLEQAMA